MHFYRKNTVKNGSIIIYTLIACSICFSCAIYCFKIELQKYENNNRMLSIRLSNTQYEECREFLLTYVYNYLNENIELKNSENLNNFIANIPDGYTISYKNSYVKYNLSKTCFVINSYVDDYIHREDYYNVYILDSSIRFKFQDTKYVEGRI
ncbi:hypothetical protein [Clostridium sp. JN-9]|uniref:hypothetical protein n=1 Tax=Clostridium sp. JN-9 TaxID=2507159 RepID=UPI000FFE201D|nr:hypothetical protein [Clostridium sp. JN-9]QAT40042.1 hypothetical protein EQM05_07125 [Clostridium sp. JN-9]